jgi:hypothetical protein
MGFSHLVLPVIRKGEETMRKWLPLILSVVLLGLVLSSGTHGEILFGTAEATFVVT